MLWLVRLGIIAVLLVAAYFLGRCGGDDYNPDQPPEVIDSLAILEDGMDFEEDIPLIEQPFKGTAKPRRQGVGPRTEEARDRNVRYAAKVFAAESIPLPATIRLAPEDTLPQMPFVRVTGEGALSLAAERSDARIVRSDFDCGDNRLIEAGTNDAGWFAHCERALPALLPRIGKTALTCAAVAGTGYGIAYLTDYEKPELAAGVAGGACVIVKVF